MSRRSNALCAAALSTLAWGASHVSAMQSGVEANGAAAIISNPASIIPDSRHEAIGAKASATRAQDDARPEDAKELPSSASTSTNESRPIGPPPSPMQTKSALPSHQTDDAVLSALDPRTNDITKVVGALAIVVGLILLLRVFLRKSGGFLAFSGNRPSGVMEILAKYPVGRGQHIVLLKVARRVILIHQSGSAMTTLSEMTDQDEVAGLLTRLEAGSSERDAERFRRTLTQFMAEHESPQEKPARSRRAQMPLAETEIVDLTRARRGFGGILGRRSAG